MGVVERYLSKEVKEEEQNKSNKRSRAIGQAKGVEQ
jgi:hypothetical protein